MNSLNFKQGDIVVADVSYSDLEASKPRPALIASSNNYNKIGDDIILIRVTSKIKGRPYDVLLEPNDLEFGKMKMSGAIKTDFLLVIEKRLIKFVVGRVKDHIVEKVKDKLRNIFNIN